MTDPNVLADFKATVTELLEKDHSWSNINCTVKCNHCGELVPLVWTRDYGFKFPHTCEIKE